MTESVRILLIKFVQVTTLPKIFQKVPIAKWIKFRLLNMAYSSSCHNLCLSFWFYFYHSKPCTLCFGDKLLLVLSLGWTSTSIHVLLFPSSRHFTWSVPNATYALLLFSIWLALVYLSTPSRGIVSPRRFTHTCQLKKFLFFCIPKQTSSLSQNINIVGITLSSVKLSLQRTKATLSSYIHVQSRTGLPNTL